jgi:hypothetical protein
LESGIFSRPPLTEIHQLTGSLPVDEQFTAQSGFDALVEAGDLLLVQVWEVGGLEGG